MTKKRNLTSNKDRVLLWLASNGKCSECGEDLPDNWHADHIIPFRLTKRTNVHEMRALCPKCNLKKGDRLMLNSINLARFREGQRGAYNTIVSRIRRGERFTSIVLPTRYGKSDVDRASSITLWRENIIPWALTLSPNAILRDQLVDDERFKACLKRYWMSGEGIAKRALTEFRQLYNPDANGEMFLSITTQLANSQRELLKDWVKKTCDKTGLSPLILIDEAHTGSETNSWGNTVYELVNAGAKAVLLTATPFRGDRLPIPGFKTREVVTEEIKIKKYRKNESLKENEIWVDIYERQKTIVMLIPDFEWTFKQAWQEPDSPICQISRLAFPVQLDRGQFLSDLSAQETRKVLGKVVRETQVIRAGVELLVKWLECMQASGVPDCLAFVFCSNDIGGDDKLANEHALKIKRAINREAPKLNVQIATSSSGNDGEDGTEIIKSVVNRNTGDVLIVKQMGGVGLDCERLKICLDLSPIRQPASFIQRAMRIATIYKEQIKHCIYICPDEILGEALWQQLVSDEGGETAINLDELLYSYKTTPNGGNISSEPPRAIEDTGDPGATDNERLKATPDEVKIAEFFASRYALVGYHTIPGVTNEVAENFEIKIKPQPGPRTIKDTGKAAEDLYDDINQYMNNAVKRKNRLLNNVGSNYNQELWQKISKQTWAELWKRCGMSWLELRAVTNIETLEKLKREAYRIEVEANENGQAY